MLKIQHYDYRAGELRMKIDKPLFDLENEYEVYMVQEVLADLGLPFRITYADNTLGIRLGAAGTSSIAPPYACLWGYADDKERIGAVLDDIRNAQPLEDGEALGRTKMWRIKKP